MSDKRPPLAREGNASLLIGTLPIMPAPGGALAIRRLAEIGRLRRKIMPEARGLGS
jgi:hypothetical protein